jgi:hypothetical protein
MRKAEPTYDEPVDEQEPVDETGFKRKRDRRTAVYTLFGHGMIVVSNNHLEY